MTRRPLLAPALLAALLALPATAGGSDPSGTVIARARHDAALADVARDTLGVTRVSILDLDAGRITPGAAFRVNLPVDGRALLLDLTPRSVRSSAYRVRSIGADGVIVEHAPSPVTTFTGHVVGDPESRVAAALLDGGLQVSVRSGDTHVWLEPLGRRLRRDGRAHAIFAHEDLDCPDVGCGVDHAASEMSHAVPAGDDFIAMAMSGGPDVAELACDADFDYFQDYGSVAAVEARINAVINQTNLQYESEVGITHDLTEILVRTAPTYTDTNASALVNALRTRWLNQHPDVPYDLVQLFTGKNLDGNTVGIALTTGSVCTFDAFSVVQSDYNGSFACATDLSAHELGHLWGASHCSCPSFTMNPSITCSNTFSTASRNAIIAHRDSRDCLNISEAAYCTAAAADSSFEYISRVELGTLDNPSGRTGYSDFTGLSTTLEVGQSADLTVTLGSGFSFDVGGVWIDWNQDFDFEDADEEITTSLSGVGPYVVTVTVPAGADPGLTRMRVRVQDGFSDPVPLPCDTAAFGEVEDYSIEVEPGAPPCPGDLNGSGDVEFQDLLAILVNWGPCPACPEDIDGDGAVGLPDLLTVLSNWGPCPGS